VDARRRLTFLVFLISALAHVPAFAAPPAAAPAAAPPPVAPPPAAAAPAPLVPPGPIAGPAAYLANRLEIQKALEQHPLQGAEIAEEAIQVVAQVIADRATESGFSILRDRLRKDLGCDAKPDPARPSFPNTCATLKVRVQDLVAQPNLLVDSAIRDLLALAKMQLDAHAAEEKTLAKEFQLGAGKIDLSQVLPQLIAAWRHVGAAGASRVLGAQIQQALLEDGAQVACPVDATTHPALQALWIVGQCIVDAKGNLKDAVAKCDVEAGIARCGASVKDPDHVRELATDLLAAVAPNTDERERPKYFVAFVMESAIIANASGNAANKATVEQLLRGIDDVLIGIFDRNWPRVTLGSVSVLEATGQLRGVTGDFPGTRTYKLLSSIGAYASTYSTSGDDSDLEAAHAARKEIVEALVKSLVNRSDRIGGTVFSFGGTFGLGGAYRHSIRKGTSGGFGPFALPIGFALDTYPESTEGCPWGFHLQVSFLDVGQYVKFEGGKADVQKPRAEDAVSVGIALGPWFGSREVPIWFGPYAGVSPFVRDDGTPSLFVGGLLGGYVSIIDLN
jgi:hypothetical protein